MMFGRKGLKRRRGHDGADVPQWPGNWALGWASVRAGRTNGWEPPPRILIEETDGALGWAIQRALRREGWDVAVCPGPDRLAGGTCPMLSDGRCPAADVADVILFGLPLSDERNRSVLEAHRRCLDTRPVLVETSIPEAKKHERVLRDLTLLHEPILGSEVVVAVEQVLTPAVDKAPHIARDA